MLVLGPLLIPLATAVLCALLSGRRKLNMVVSLAGSVLLLGSATALLVNVIQHGRQSVALGDWPLPYAIEFAADGLSAAMILVTALLGMATTLYQASWNDGTAPQAALPSLMHGLLASAMATYLAADLFNLYVWLELMFITTLGTLVVGGQQRQAEAAFKYFAINMLGTLLLLAAVALIYGVSGHLNFAAIREAAQRPEVAAGLTVYTGLLVLAFLVKAGVFPLFFWLPASYHTLPAPLLGLVGGLLTKVAAYVLLRLLGEVFITTPGSLLDALGWLAMVTMVVGVLGAAYHWDLRRILAFHIVSQIGYLLFGIALASPAAAAASTYFALHNILVKSNLFFIAGIMCASAGHYDLRRIGGLYLRQPLLALLFLVSALSLVGVPPSSGFWGKFMLIREAFGQRHYIWGGIALAVGLLTLYSMSKIWLEGFWKPHPKPDELSAARRVPLSAYAAVVMLSGAILVLGLFPEPFIHLMLSSTADFWNRGGAS